MNKLYLLIFCILLAGEASSQKLPSSDTALAKHPTTDAVFPKGEKGWHRFLSRKMDDFTAEPTYPKGDFELTVTISFVVDVDGSIVELKVHQSSGNKRIDNYAIRVLQASPKWVPATENGINIKAKVLQSITFTGRQF